MAVPRGGLGSPRLPFILASCFSVAPLDSMPDSILPRVAAGDSQAVEACLGRYGGLVWSLALRMCRARDDAEEATQEIFLEIWRQAGRFDEEIATEATFIAMIARRRLIDRHRRSQRQPTMVCEDQLDGTPAEPPVGCPVELAEEAARAREGLTRLGDDERRFIEWSVCDGMSHAEVASRSGQPLGTVKSKIRRGLIRLRELLDPQPQQGGVA